MHKVRDFTLELLRHGPVHNQLLSPLTPYLALCGDHRAETVHVPYEHRQFLDRLQDLRYTRRASGRRELVIQETARELAEILAAVPGLGAELARASRAEGELTHLRLVVSAAELALLPFELSLSPGGCPGAGEPLFLQTAAPVTITRETRQTGGHDFCWPRRPRILFAAASPAGVGEIPLRDHVVALRRVVEPWVWPYDPEDKEARNREVGRRLTLLPEASVESIQDACAGGGYTHVHLLAHGAEIGRGVDQRFGLALHRSDGAGTDVVDGARLATALRAHRSGRDDGLSHPAVVTVATCDSGNVGSVVVPGASLAHDLHQAGIPLVVASQFPLSFGGSVQMVRVLYERLLRGDDPRVILHDLRWRLHVGDAETHDWASLVAYAAFPRDLEAQLDECRYSQAKAAVEAALARADWVVQNSAEVEDGRELLEHALAKLDQALEGLPDLPSDPTESTGIRASMYKRKAQLLHHAVTTGAAGEPETLEKLDDALEQSREHYRRAFRENMSSHWVGVQFLSLSAVLGELDEVKAKLWTVVEVAAEGDLQSGVPVTVAWAHSSLAELYLLAPVVLPDQDDAARDRWTARAREHLRQLVEIVGRDAFAVKSTRRQLERYRDWWTGVAAPGAVEQLLEEL